MFCQMVAQSVGGELAVKGCLNVKIRGHLGWESGLSNSSPFHLV